MRERSRFRATFVVAPAGYGKSTLLREAALEDRSVYVPVAAGSTFARFTADITRLAAVVVPGLDRSFAGAFSRATQTDDAPRTLARWFARQIGEASCRFVVDGLDRASGDLVGSFLHHAIEASPPSVTWLVASRHLDTLAVDALLAFGHASLPLDHDDLRLRPAELRALGAAIAPALDASGLRAIGEKAAGSIARASFSLHAHAHGVAGVADPNVPFEALLARVFDACSPAERSAALALSILPESAVDAAPEPAIERLRERAPYLFEGGGRRLAASFAEWLAVRFAELSASARDELRIAGAARLEAIGDVRGALSLLSNVADESLALACIERHAATALEREHLHFLHDSVAHLSEEVRRTHPTVLAFLAMEASLGNQVDLAESLFANALRAAQARESPKQAHSVRYWYACELVRRDRNDAIALLRPDVEFFKASPRLRVAMSSTLAVAYAKDGKLERGQRWVDRALRYVRRIDDDGIRAYVHHQASYIALCAGNGAEARRLAELAVEFAAASGSAQIATAATSVLYAVAMDLEDDLSEAARHLQRLSTFAARTANVSGQLYALAALFEIETDRGNAAAIAEVERELAEFDLQYGAALESETIVPAQAIQHAWRCDFERAYRILAGSDEQQFTDDRRALRLAEIAVYAAAAGYEREACVAVSKALGILQPGGRELRTLRARGFAALALVLTGRTEDAVPVLRDLKTSAREGSRSAVFGRLVTSLVERRDGFRVSRDVAAALEELRRREWGGIARMIENLPSDLVASRRTQARRRPTACSA